MAGGPVTGWLGALALLWLLLAVAAVLYGLRAAARGRRAEAEARAIADLLAGSPALPVLVYAGDRLDADPRLGNWLGLGRTPTRLDELGRPDGLADADLQAIGAAIEAARTLGRSFKRLMPLADGRTLIIRGSPHAVAGRPHAVLLWISDVSLLQAEVERARADEAHARTALDGLSALIEAAPFPMWYRAPDLALALVNGAYVAALEAAGADEVVAHGLELIDGGQGTLARAGASDAQAGGRAVVRTLPAIVAGERRLLRVVDVPVGAVGVAGYAIDVQEVEEARTELSLFVRAQRDMLDRLSAGVAQFAHDGSLSFWNSHFAALFALPPEWLRDGPTFDVVLDRMREVQRAPEARDFPGWRAERRAWFASAEPVEENWLLPGGTHLRVVAQPLPDRGLLLIFEDRTEHLRLASARDTLLRVRTATFDNLFEAIGVFAADGRLQLWNHRFGDLFQLPAEELARHPRIDQLAQALAPRLANPTRAGLIRDTVRIAAHDRQPRSGRLGLVDDRHFDFAAVPLPDGNALFTLLDVTAARQNEQALRDRNDALETADRLKNGFVASMSYELRVPLTSITGFAEMLAGGYGGELPPTARDYVDAIVTAVARLSALTGDLIDLTQSELGSLPLESAPVALGDAVRATLERAREPAWAAGLTLAADVAADIGTVLGDARRLEQAFDHLLRNAIAYTPAGGRVVLRARREAGWAELRLSDTGRGMTEDQLARAFDRLDHGAGGMGDALGVAPAPGVGLPLARQLTEAHGGTLALSSRPGRGTIVTVRLPLMPA